MTSPRTTDARVAEIAEKQHGVISVLQLRQLGFTHSSIAKRVRAGRLHRVHRGVVAVGHGALSRSGVWMAAVLAVGDGSALSHVAAAAHWGIWKRPVHGIDVVSPHRSRGLTGIRVHACRNLGRRDIRRRFGIPVTSVARTILDLADVLTPWQVANVIHEAEFRQVFRLKELTDLLARNRGRQAVTIVRKALALRADGSVGTMSGLEDEFLARAHQRGLDPKVGIELDLGDGRLRVDFVWTEARVIVEVDGDHHDRIRTRREDLGRDARCRAAGHTVLRCRRSTFDRCLDRVEELLGVLVLPV